MRYPLLGIRHKKALGSLNHYLIGFTLVVGAVILRLIITSQTSASAPFITFFPATALAALIGGLGPGLMVAGFGGILASLFFFPHPISEFVTEDWVLLLFYFITEIVICLVIDAMHSANNRYLTLIEEVESKTKSQTSSLKPYLSDTTGRKEEQNFKSPQEKEDAD
ncbi:DUF4118 domain-containing protein [Sedimenticola selenatireducens]|uniref:DUF4118 domain-containing protein n=1 Tax=Sedimenticola selenatireducens TaxID=191960 RepID=UPI002AAB55D9|nr:DUF4118 domain-containing protein [Sedimenticola selenatireducens]